MRPIALVTGGASNIGWACVRRLAADHDVVIADLKPPPSRCPRVCATSRWTSPMPACQRAGRCRRRQGLAVLVHSAAITAPARPSNRSRRRMAALIDVNLTGAFLVAQAAIAHLRRARGAAVMIASRAGRTGYAALNASPSGTKAHYAASKAALLSLVKSLAIELAPDGVRVNAVVPGSIEGAMIPRERWPELAARIPLGRLGTPDEVAEAVRWLCTRMPVTSPATRWTSTAAPG
jgi:NAD(P)-dependent dehydrogenase (short-subunit alcohol dehydrogenase family)